jgi:hypothetical protein
MSQEIQTAEAGAPAELALRGRSLPPDTSCAREADAAAGSESGFARPQEALRQNSTSLDLYVSIDAPAPRGRVPAKNLDYTHP